MQDGGPCTAGEAIVRLDNNPEMKLRCQTPYRESDSWAAFLRVSSRDGKPYLYDSGDGTTHWLCDEDYFMDAFEDIAEQDRARQVTAREEVEVLVVAGELLYEPEVLVEKLRQEITDAGYSPPEYAGVLRALPEAIRAAIGPPQRPRFAPEDMEEFLNRPPRGWFIKRVLPRAPLGLILGAPGTGKSFLVIDLSLAVARGCPGAGTRSSLRV